MKCWPKPGIPKTGIDPKQAAGFWWINLHPYPCSFLCDHFGDENSPPQDPEWKWRGCLMQPSHTILLPRSASDTRPSKPLLSLRKGNRIDSTFLGCPNGSAESGTLLVGSMEAGPKPTATLETPLRNRTGGFRVRSNHPKGSPNLRQPRTHLAVAQKSGTKMASWYMEPKTKTSVTPAL